MIKQYPLKQHSLKSHNTLAVDVWAEYYWPVNNEAELMAALDWYQNCQDQQDLKLMILGGGSNIVLQDHFSGLVIHMCQQGFKQKAKTQDWIELEVMAGQNWHQLVVETNRLAYFGLENLALIPGSVGAAPIQNIGAYGVEIKDVLTSLRAYNLDSKEFETLSAAECQLSYRDSLFKQAGQPQRIICSVTLRLSLRPGLNLSYPGLHKALTTIEQPAPKDVVDAVCKLRREKLPEPEQLPNVGSFFKNPIINAEQFEALKHSFPDVVSYPQPNQQYKLAAAWLIDQAGWKGKRHHNVGVHQNQALVLVSFKSAKTSGAEVLTLAGKIQQDIRQRFSIDLDIEPRVY